MHCGMHPLFKTMQAPHRDRGLDKMRLCMMDQATGLDLGRSDLIRLGLIGLDLIGWVKSGMS